MSDLIGAVVCT